MVAEEGAARLAEVADDGDEEAHDEDDREEQLVEPTRGAVRSKQFFPAFHAVVIPPGNRGGISPRFQVLATRPAVDCHPQGTPMYKKARDQVAPAEQHEPTAALALLLDERGEVPARRFEWQHTTRVKRQHHLCLE